MLNEDDKKFLTETFATKKELAEVKIDVTDLKVDSKLLQEALIRLEKNVEEGVELSRKTLTTVENFAGNISALEQENKMGAITLRRHGVQIRELATATGAIISE